MTKIVFYYFKNPKLVVVFMQLIVNIQPIKHNIHDANANIQCSKHNIYSLNVSI